MTSFTIIALLEATINIQPTRSGLALGAIQAENKTVSQSQDNKMGRAHLLGYPR